MRKNRRVAAIIYLSALGVLAAGAGTLARRGELPFLGFESLAKGFNEEVAAEAAMALQRRRQTSCLTQQVAACHAERNLKGPCPLAKASSR
jgi:hypothetical protein